MRTCPSCGGIVGRDCFNPVECAQITESQNQQHDRNHWQEGYNQGYHEGLQASKSESPSADQAGDKSEYTKQRAVEFVEWKEKNEYVVNAIEQRIHTTSELYDLFTKENPE